MDIELIDEQERHAELQVVDRAVFAAPATPSRKLTSRPKKRHGMGEQNIHLGDDWMVPPH